MEAQHANEAFNLVDMIRVGWPIVVVIAGIIIFIATEASMNKTSREDSKSFMRETYPKDKDGLLSAIEKVREEQAKSEVRLEAKLDKISDQASLQFEKMAAELGKANILLANIQGRLSNTGSVPINETRT